MLTRQDVTITPKSGLKHAARTPWYGPRTSRAAVLHLYLILSLSIVGLAPVFLTGDTTSSVVGGAAGNDGDSLRQGLFALLLISVIFDAFRKHGLGFIAQIPISFAIVIMWCWISLVWALDPSIAFRRTAFTTLVVVSIIVSVRNIPPHQTIQVLWTLLATIVLLDWLSVAFFADAIHQPDLNDPALGGSWRGVHTNKNDAGAFCAIACLVFFHQIRFSKSYLTGPILFSLSLAFLYKTASKTSIGFLFVAILLGFLSEYTARHPAARSKILLAMVFLSLTILTFVELPVERLAMIFDDPAALTGRVQIWPVIVSYLNDHLLLGAGYGSFWAIGPDSPILKYTSGWITGIDHAHNGYLNMAVQIGLLGTILVVLLLIIQPAIALFSRPFAILNGRQFVCSVLIFCWLRDFLESSFLDRANTAWVLMLVMYALLADALVKPASTARPQSEARVERAEQ